MSEYRINYVIERRQAGAGDFAEVGFGSSGDSDDIESALYAVQSDIQNQQWEISPGMPDPADA